MRILDIARGQYVRSPAWVRRAFAPAISMLPTKLKYGGTYARWREDIERSRHDAGFVQDRRLGALRRLYHLSMANSAFWRERFNTAFGGSPPSADEFDFDDVARLPVLQRDDIIANKESLLTAPVRQLDLASTSGSSGRPLVFYLDPDRSPKEMAFVNANWAQCGYVENEPKAVFRGLPFDRHEQGYYWEPALEELRLSPWSMTPARMDTYLELIEEHRIRFLYGYPSCIEILGRHIERRGLGACASIVGLLLISEPCYAHQRQIMRRSFPGAMIVEQYGMSERVAFGSAVPELDGQLDLEPLYGYTEIVGPDGRQLSEAGERGRIVSTGFISFGMPLWRYDTGDLATIVRTAEPANCFRLRVCDIEPRTAALLMLGAAGERIDLNWFAQPDPSSFAMISEFQYYQDKPGEAEVRIVPVAGYRESEIAAFVAVLQQSMGTSIRLKPVVVDRIAQNERGKRKLAIQKLQID